MKFKSVKGTRDIFGEEVHRWLVVEREIRSVMQAFTYREIRTPVFEETALFARGIGELTDIVGKEMYTFQERGGDSLTLKPEMTASVVRAYIQNNLGAEQPFVKLYYLSPMFRQERPQAGRLRQFHQFGAEAIGAAEAEVDAEIIALSTAVYEDLGIHDIQLKVNSVGCEQCRPRYREELKKFLKTRFDNLSAESKKRFEQNPLRILDSKDEQDQRATAGAPLMKDHLCKECESHFSRLQSALTAINVKFVIDGRIVRGLDYYTKTAYEIVSSDLGSQDALAGGGRYDLLVKQLGGPATPAVGFAAGIERLLMVLEKQNTLKESAPVPTVYLVAADDEGRRWVFQEAFTLRRAGIATEVDMLGRSVKSQMRDADRQKAQLVIVVGDREVREGAAQVKNMESGQQQTVSFSNLTETLRNVSHSR